MKRLLSFRKEPPSAATSSEPRLIDNINGTMELELLTAMGSSARLDATIGYFNLRGWRMLADAVDDLPENPDGPRARILVGMHESPEGEMRRLAEQEPLAHVDRSGIVGEYREQLQVGMPTAGDERSLRALKKQIEDGHVEVRVHTAHRLHAKLYLCHRESGVPVIGYVGSSNLTSAGLSYPGELNAGLSDTATANKLAAWFEERWNDPETYSALPELLEALQESWALGQSAPYLVYLRMAYHLCEEARKGIGGGELPLHMREDLLDFQADAAKIAAKIVMGRGGAMIGDVVGLGKTREAIAVACLLQQQHNFETLVICPKNLVAMWEGYLHKYEVRGRVKSLSMAHVEMPRTLRHRLVIIDESHHLRNSARRDYKAIKEYIDANESKVLLLTATPYNKHHHDIFEQLSLFVPLGADLGISPRRSGALVATSTFSAFRDCEDVRDWRDVLSLFLVRRTRSFIEANYAHFDDEKQRHYLQYGSGEGDRGSRYYFPKRKPMEIEHVPTADDPAGPMASDVTLDAIDSLRLPRYRIGEYLAPGGYTLPSEEERELRRDLQESAKGNLSTFTKIMLFKRLSSSGPAFLATLRRLRKRNQIVLHALDSALPVPIGATDESLWTEESDEEPESADTDGDSAVIVGALETTGEVAYHNLRKADPKAIRWASPDMFTDGLAEDLRHDISVIEDDLLYRFGRWDSDKDGKLQQLIRIITQQHPTKKVLVFSEAADTAKYLETELIRAGIREVGIVTGDTEDPTSVVQRFAPLSNPATGDKAQGQGNLRVLVSTDILSEGQNLQDSHIVVNYDLPWAIVKLIQRAGRVDRIGQEHPDVLIYSLNTTGSVEAEIGLRRRISQRLSTSAQILGSDESFFGGGDEEKVLRGDYAAVSEQIAGLDEVDPVSLAYEIWNKASKAEQDRVASMPNVIYSTRGTTAGAPHRGVLVHTKNRIGSDAFAFVQPDGSAARVHPAAALKMAQCDPDTPTEEAQADHHGLTRIAVRGLLNDSTAGGKGSKGWHESRGIWKPLDVGETSLTGPRRKLWERLGAHLKSLPDHDRGEIEDVRNAVGEHPLSSPTEMSASLNDMDDKALADLALERHKSGELVEADSAAGEQRSPKIICTMGFVDGGV